VARHEAARGLLEQARESLALAEGRYQAGAGSVLEVADAQAAFTAAGFGLVRAHLDVATARARLVRATGGP
jgi:outer membrane protein